MSDILHQILSVGTLLNEKQKALKKCEEYLSELKAEIDLISKTRLPDLMQSVGLSEVTLRDGTKIVVKPEVTGMISKDRMDTAIDWLDANGMGAIAKRKLVVDFENREALVAANTPFKIDSSVHYMTLQGFVREQVATNPDFPRELFGVQEGFKATIK